MAAMSRPGDGAAVIALWAGFASMGYFILYYGSLWRSTGHECSARDTGGQDRDAGLGCRPGNCRVGTRGRLPAQCHR